MRGIKLFMLTTAFVAATFAMENRAAGQCSGGSCQGGYCPLPQYEYDGWRAAPLPRYDFEEADAPTPAWRYEECKGKYKSVVRIVSDDGGNSRSKGSGCVVRWGKRLVVVTACHVVRSAKRVFVRGKSKYHRCRVLGTDRTWDVAVLEPESGDDFDAADIAWAETGMLKTGDRVESCGFGPDERLAVNSGRVLQFNRPQGAAAPDWLCMSGSARQGDSGGPVLNEQGELVGVVWGTSGRTVLATQCGRLHAILSRAAGPFSFERQYTTIVNQRPIVPVIPTANAGVSVQAGLFRDGPLCPPRKPPSREPAQQQPNVVVEADPRVGDSLASINAKLDTVVQNTTPPEEEESENKDKPPIFAVLASLAGVVIGFVVYFAAQKGN